MTLPESAAVRTPNAELAYRVLDHIKADPASWHQGRWWLKNSCGTSGCFAGWAVALSGLRMSNHLYPVVDEPSSRLDDVYVPVAAADLLGLPDEIESDADAENIDLFAAGNTLEDLEKYVADIFGPRPDPHCGPMPESGWQCRPWDCDAPRDCPLPDDLR